MLYIYIFKYKTAAFVKGKQSRYYCIGFMKCLQRFYIHVCNLPFSCFSPQVVRIVHYAVSQFIFHLFSMATDLRFFSYDVVRVLLFYDNYFVLNSRESCCMFSVIDIIVKVIIYFLYFFLKYQNYFVIDL